ncbi:claudin-20 [Aplochiton taeniatus]
MASSAMQILAFALALLGVLGATVATLLPNWKVSADVGSNIMTAISQMQGLWMDCTWYSTGVFSCTLKYSVLALPAYLQTARTTMVLSCMMACLGLCLAALGLKCTRWGGSHRAKGQTAIAAGGCFVLAGVLCLVPASWFTNEVITSFLDSNVPQSSKYEPGGAVYVTFISAGFLLSGGVIFCLSCPTKREGPLDYTSSTDPEKLLQQQLRQEQLHREQLQREQLHREQAILKEQPCREQPNRDKNLKDELLQDNTEEDAPSHEKLQQAQEKLYYSPSKLPPKDIKAGYTLQDYV